MISKGARECFVYIALPGHDDSLSAWPQDPAHLRKDPLGARRMVDDAPRPDQVEAPIRKLHFLGIHLQNGSWQPCKLQPPAGRRHSIFGQIDTDV
jgi:hypothetical protein